MEGTIAKKKSGIFKNKDYMLLFLGQLVSNVGNAVFFTAVAWYIMSFVGEVSSGKFIAIFGICMAVPAIILGPVSGVLVDKLDRKKIIVGTDFLRGVLMLALAAFIYFQITPLIALFTVTVLGSFLGTLFNPAVSASIPNIVDEEDLTRANSLSGIARQMTWIIGAAVSGFLYFYTGFVGILLINGVSFIASGFSEMFINLSRNHKKSDTDKEEEKEKKSFWQDFKEGFSVIRSQKAIMTLMGFVLVLNFLFNPIFQVVFPKTIKFTLGMGSREYGILNAISPIGAILGMVLLSILPQKEKNYKTMMFTIIMHGVLLTLLGIPLIPIIYKGISNMGVYISFCGIFFLFGIFNALLNVPLTTTFQKRIPDEYRGRFFGILSTLSQGITPLGLLAIGFIADIFTPEAIFIAGGLITIALSIWMLFVPDLKEL